MSYHVLTGMMTLGGPGSGIEGHTTPKEKEDSEKRVAAYKEKVAKMDSRK